MDDYPSEPASFIDQHKISIALSVVGGVLLIGGIASSGIIPKIFLKSTTTPSAKTTSETKQTIKKEIKVDLSGAVKTPGVYTMPPDARLEDILKMAGGVSEQADAEYLAKSLNLAQKVSDGMKIYIPFKGEKVDAQTNLGVASTQVAGSSTSSSGKSSAQSVVNVNSASVSELDQLPGVGPVTAQKIIDQRPYSSIEELLTKKAVTKATYDKIKDQVSTQ